MTFQLGLVDLTSVNLVRGLRLAGIELYDVVVQKRTGANDVQAWRYGRQLADHQ